MSFYKMGQFTRIQPLLGDQGPPEVKNPLGDQRSPQAKSNEIILLI